MIELFDVKKYNKYDFVQDTIPATDGTWLCSSSATPYVRGYSYKVASGVASRLDSVNDLRIQESIHSTIENVFNWLNNPFYAPRALQENISLKYVDSDYFMPVRLANKWRAYESDTGRYSFLNGEVSGIQTESFQVGDLVSIEGALRNNIVGYITGASSGTVTLDNPNIRNTVENAVMFLSDIPKQVEQYISQMINYDVFLRPKPSSLGGETIGNYSYSKEVLVKNSLIRIGSLDYPTDMVQNLARYKRVNYVS